MQLKEGSCHHLVTYQGCVTEIQSPQTPASHPKHATYRPFESDSISGAVEP